MSEFFSHGAFVVLGVLIAWPAMLLADRLLRPVDRFLERERARARKHLKGD